MAGTSKTNRQEDGMPLAGKVALVTGGSRGIGRAIALRLAGLGAAVAICGRDREAMEATSRELGQTTEGVLAHVADVTRSEDVAKLVAATETKLDPLRSWSTMRGLGCSDRRMRKRKRIGIAC